MNDNKNEVIFLTSCCGTNRIPVLNGLLLLYLANAIETWTGLDNNF